VFTGPQGIANKLPRSVKAAALAVSLVFSAFLTAVPSGHAGITASPACSATSP
jgi:hypothetical protein